MEKIRFRLVSVQPDFGYVSSLIFILSYARTKTRLRNLLTGQEPKKPAITPSFALILHPETGNQFEKLCGLLAVVTLFLGGCTIFRSNQPNLTIDVAEQLPNEWAVVDSLREINIDDDAEMEYLIFFAYDGGAIGVAVYDQISPDAVTADDGVTSQSVGVSKLYTVLPTFWGEQRRGWTAVPANATGAIPHFVAPPGQAENLSLTPVKRIKTADGSSAIDDSGTLVGNVDELIIRGGDSYITFLWWENTIDGYGVAQIHAPGGFSAEEWGAGLVNQAPLIAAVGAAPMHDRSQLCRKYRFQRQALRHDPADQATQQRPVYRQPITYLQFPMGIHFCGAIPAHPFYPEGVVLAYLLQPAAHGNLIQPGNGQFASGQSDSTADEARRAALQTVIDETINLELLANERIVDIKTRALIPAPALHAIAEGTEIPLPTTVCVDLIANETQIRRRLFFTLLHHPLAQGAQRRDRFYIANVNALPLTMDGIGSTCQEIIEQSPPRE